MRLKVSIETDIELLHITGKQMILQDNIIKEYESLIGYKRDEDKTKFDE